MENTKKTRHNEYSKTQSFLQGMKDRGLGPGSWTWSLEIIYHKNY